MSQNNFDPYQPPSLGTGSVPTNSEIETMRNIAFWQRFFSILGYILSGIMVLVFIVQTLVAASSLGRGPAIIGGLITTMVVLALTVVMYIIPAILLGNASKATRDFGEGRVSLGEYAAQQKKFWRYVGMMVCIVLGIYLTILVVAVFLGLAFSMGR